MIGYDLLLGHVAPAAVNRKARPRKIVADEMACSVQRAEQRARNGELFNAAARNRARILKFLRTHGPTGKTALCDALDITEDQFKRSITTLRDQGLVRLQDARRWAKWAAIGERQ